MTSPQSNRDTHIQTYDQIPMNTHTQLLNCRAPLPFLHALYGALNQPMRVNRASEDRSLTGLTGRDAARLKMLSKP